MKDDFVPKAILFDFDGVLADTMGDNLRAWQSTLSTIGVSFGAQEYLELEGMKMVDVARTLCAKHGVKDGDWEHLVQNKDRYYSENNSFRLYPGALELLRALKDKNIPVALVSAGRLNRLEKFVPAGFLDLFRAVITGEKTERGKPFPDPYLAASKELGVKPELCLAVENAPLGIDSAKAAGMRCIAISSTLSEDKLAKADRVVPKLEDLARAQLFIDIFK
ncbi:MAG TPA: HAD family phosphatase [Candidatus Paceibacterota bacterium]